MSIEFVARTRESIPAHAHQGVFQRIAGDPRFHVLSHSGERILGLYAAHPNHGREHFEILVRDTQVALSCYVGTGQEMSDLRVAVEEAFAQCGLRLALGEE